MNANEDYIQRHEVMEIFAKEIALTKEEEEFSAYHLLHILSAILNYEEQLEHLDKLIVSFQRHHNNEVNIGTKRGDLLKKVPEVINGFRDFFIVFNSSYEGQAHHVIHPPSG